VCLKTRDDNQRAIDEFADQWRVRAADPAADDPADPFNCFYDASDPRRVIPHKTYSRADVVHCMLWPSLVVVASAVTFLYLEARRSRLTFCGHRRPSVALVDGEKSQLKPVSSSTSSQHAVKVSSSKHHHEQHAVVNDHHALKPAGAAAEMTSSKVSELHAARQRDGRHGLPATDRLNGQVQVRSSVDVRGTSPTAAADGPASRRVRRLHDRSAAAKSHSASSLVAGVETTTTAADLGRRAAGCGDEPRLSIVRHQYNIIHKVGLRRRAPINGRCAAAVVCRQR